MATDLTDNIIREITRRLQRPEKRHPHEVGKFSYLENQDEITILVHPTYKGKNITIIYDKDLEK